MDRIFALALKTIINGLAVVFRNHCTMKEREKGKNPACRRVFSFQIVPFEFSWISTEFSKNMVSIRSQWHKMLNRNIFLGL